MVHFYHLSLEVLNRLKLLSICFQGAIPPFSRQNQSQFYVSVLVLSLVVSPETQLIAFVGVLTKFAIMLFYFYFLNTFPS